MLAAMAAPFVNAPASRTLVVSFLLVQAEYPFFYGFLYGTLAPAAGVLILMRTVWLWRFVAQILGASPEAARDGLVRGRMA